MNSAHEAPLLVTDRLRLRARTIDDFPFFRAMWADKNVTRYIGGLPKNEEDSWSKFLRMIGHWAINGYGYWAVEEKNTGALIGEVGFGEFKRDILPSIIGQPEAGWVFAPSAHGVGYGTEAALAVIRWGDDYFESASCMSCLIDPMNTASIRVAEKCGFTVSTQTTYHDDAVLLMHRKLR